MTTMGCKLGVVCCFLIIAASAAAPSPQDGFRPDLKQIQALCVQNDGGILAGGFGFYINNRYVGIFCRMHPDGSMDSAFNTNVKLNGMVAGIVEDKDGKLLVSGNVQPRNRPRSAPVVRYHANGLIDDTFQSELTTTGSTFSTYVATQADGKIVVTGNFGNTIRSVVRLNADGSIDTTFQAPVLGVEKGYKNVTINAVAALSDGRIVVAGTALDSSKLNWIYMVRLNPDGSLDSSFNNVLNGKAGFIRKLIVQPDGRILVGGTGTVSLGYRTPFITRLKADGSVDPVFGIKSRSSGSVYCDYYLETRQTDGKILVGCTNYLESKATYRLERWMPDGAKDPSYDCPLPRLSEYCVAAIQPDGKLLIEEYYSVETEYLGLTRIYPDGSIDEDFNAGVKIDDMVDQALFQPDGKLLVCGNFTSINGIMRNRIARFNADGALDSGFDPGGGADAEIIRMALQPDGKILIGGLFQNFNGVAREQLARLNADGSLDQAFHPVFSYRIPIGIWPYQHVMNHRFAVRPDGKILISGNFDGVDGVTRKTFAQLNPDGSLDTSFEPPSDVFAVGEFVLLQTGKVYTCGLFGVGGGTNDRYLDLLNINGSIDTAFSADKRINPITSVTVQPDGKLLILSGNSPYSGYTLTRLNTDGTSDPTFTRRTMAAVQSVTAWPDGRIIIAGDLTPTQSGPNLSLNQVKCLNVDGSEAAGFSGGEVADQKICQTLLMENGQILVCGQFNNYLGEYRSRVAVLNADGSVDAHFLFGFSRIAGEIDALATREDGSILIGGAFDTVAETSCSGAARLCVDCDLFTTFSARARQVEAMAALPDGRTCVGDRVTSGPEMTITRRNIDGTTDTSFRKVVTDGDVSCMIAQPDGGMIIAGNFHNVCGITRNQVARIDEIGSVTLTFNTGHGFDAGELHYIHHGDTDSSDQQDELIIEQRGRVNSIALQSGKIIAGGLFDRVALVNRGNIARLHMNGVLDQSFDPGTGTDGEVFAVAVQPDGKVLIAGVFTRVDGLERNGIARLNADGSVDQGFVTGNDEYDYFHSMALRADGKILMGGFYSSSAGYGRIAQLNADGTLDRLFETPEEMSFDFGGIHAIALQNDGKVLAGGLFGNIGATVRRNLARISNPDAALQSLSVAPGGVSVTWKLGGSYPQPYQALFEESADGVNWSVLGWGTPVAGVGFTITHTRLPLLANHYVRATGWTTGGLNNGSVSLHRSTLYCYSSSYNGSSNWACYE